MRCLIIIHFVISFCFHLRLRTQQSNLTTQTFSEIALLLDPSLQCAGFIYDELIKISHRCLVNELQRFPVLRKLMDEVIGNSLREGLEPSETMIGQIIEMEMFYINTSHPNFIGGSKAVEIALQQIKSSKFPLPMGRQKGVRPMADVEKSCILW